MPRECQFLTLPDQRRMAFTEWGDPQGLPVVYCHGFPGSRLEGRLADEPARRLGIRLIAPDRPGFGASQALRSRRLSDWPADLAALAEALDLPRLALLGVSGGGPYALAAGQLLGDRIRRIALVCGLGELHDHHHVAGMNAASAASIRFFQTFPAFAQWSYAELVGPLLGRHPDLIFKLLTGVEAPADRAVLADPRVRTYIADSFREAFRHGGEGPAQELGLLTRPWDIDPGQVRVPVQLWHGEADRTVPVAMARRHADLLPQCQARFLPDEGHFSLVVHYLEGILRALSRTGPEAAF